MKFIKKHWNSIPVVIRKPLIFIMGITIILTGIIMLVIPGPGWAAIFLGFALLATEFAFAMHVRDWMVVRLNRLIDWGKNQLNKIKKNPPKNTK